MKRKIKKTTTTTAREGRMENQMKVHEIKDGLAENQIFVVWGNGGSRSFEYPLSLDGERSDDSAVGFACVAPNEAEALSFMGVADDERFYALPVSWERGDSCAVEEADLPVSDRLKSRLRAVEEAVANENDDLKTAVSRLAESARRELPGLEAQLAATQALAEAEKGL